MRASCMHTQPCYDLVYVSGDGTPHGTRSPRLDKLPHCQTSRARGVQIECLDRYVASHPLPPASCPDDAYDCPRSATITFY